MSVVQSEIEEDIVAFGRAHRQGKIAGHPPRLRLEKAGNKDGIEAFVDRRKLQQRRLWRLRCMKIEDDVHNLED